MIAMTGKNGKSVRLSADFHLDTEKEFYTVYSGGTTFEFPDFRPAAHVYKTLSKYIEDEVDVTPMLRNLARAARLLGYSVKEVA